jgi:hypothetical protein
MEDGLVADEKVKMTRADRVPEERVMMFLR